MPVDQRNQCFTPPELVKEVLDIFGRENIKGKMVIEPGAGDGAFIPALLECEPAGIVAIEIDPHYVEILRERFPDSRIKVVHKDLLARESVTHLSDVV